MSIPKEELYPIVREIVLQELEIRIPIHSEIVDLKSSVERLILAQEKTEERIEELVQAQKRTEEEIRELTLALKNIQEEINGITKELGELSHSIGFQLEDRAYRSLPFLLKRDFGIEVKANLSLRHVIDFVDRLKDIREVIAGEIFPIIVTYMTEPEIEEFAKSKGITIYYSYDFEPIY
ncbi:MAG: hypothetical protein CBR30_06185 [Dictyoglomus sp. NZ13-RE01]|nr:MAG: hypothetical protein CBR30_06185 [Dictyoglomus sp. NZ13-RE01]